MKIEPQIEAMLAQVELRVLYGPQAGSRLSISPGKYLLGTGDECEIILAGPRMRETHANLEFDGEIPSIAPVEGSVFDAQGNEISDILALRLGMPVELGGVWITIDLLDSEWPDAEDIAAIAGLSSPPPPQIEPASPPSMPTAARLAPQSVLINKVSLALRSTYVPFVAVALLVIASLVTTALLLRDKSAPQTSKAVAENSDSSEKTRDLRDFLARVAPKNDFSITSSADGKLQITGYVRDPASRKTILEAIRKNGGSYSVKIYVDSELFDACRKVVEQQADPHKIKVVILSVANGHALVAGAIGNLTIRESLFERIRSEVPGIQSISGSLLAPEDLSAVLQERINASNFGTKLQIVERQPEFIVRGRLLEQDIPKWESLLTAFGSEYASVLPIRATVSVVRRNPPIEVQMVLGGTTPFVVTTDGIRIGKGGDSNGYVLSTVGDQEVVFEGKERFKLGR